MDRFRLLCCASLMVTTGLDAQETTVGARRCQEVVTMEWRFQVDTRPGTSGYQMTTLLDSMSRQAMSVREPEEFILTGPDMEMGPPPAFFYRSESALSAQDSTLDDLADRVMEYVRVEGITDSAMTVGILMFLVSGGNWSSISGRQRYIAAAILGRVPFREDLTWRVVGDLSLDWRLRYQLYSGLATSEWSPTAFQAAFRYACQGILAFNGLGGRRGGGREAMPVAWFNSLYRVLHALEREWNDTAERVLGCRKETCFESVELPEGYFQFRGGRLPLRE